MLTALGGALGAAPGLLGAARGQPPQGAAKIRNETFEWLRQRLPTRHQYIIVAGRRTSRGSDPHRFFQAAADAVALGRAADLTGYGEAETRRVLVTARTRLQREGGGRNPQRSRRGQEVRALPQPFHGLTP